MTQGILGAERGVQVRREREDGGFNSEAKGAAFNSEMEEATSCAPKYGKSCVRVRQVLRVL